MTDFERHQYDVVVIGAGGAGLRAAIEAREHGLRTAIVCKSLFGKAHTVMAEGGIAAAMGNVNSKDSWQVHFRDTMRGGKFLNNPRMAELHAQESPDRVWELETYGALFDRTPDGRISQRNFGGHEYPRLAHVGDRTGLELIRTLQQKIVSLQQDDLKEHGDFEARIKVFAECTITDLPRTDGKVSGALGYWRESGKFVVFEAPAVIIATGGIGKNFKITSNSWEGTGDGLALALRTGATLVNMEFIQFHPTGMIWPPSVKGLLVTESVRGDGGVLRNSEGKRFMFDYVPEVFRGQYAESEEEGDRWYKDQVNNKRPPELLPRDEVARAINSEVKAGRGTPHGGVYLDVSTRMTPDVIKKKLPAMHHQFKELADVDITKEPMEVGPTCHYLMGGIEVDADTTASRVPGLFATGEAAAVAPFENEGENPYTLHQELQQTMNDLVGIIRSGGEVREAIAALDGLRVRAATVSVEGHRQFNPGWHLALDLRNMLTVSTCVALAALEREESRGGHTREDFPGMNPNWRGVNLICSLDGEGGSALIEHKPVPTIRRDLLELFERGELSKYLTEAEVATLDDPSVTPEQGTQP